MNNPFLHRSFTLVPLVAVVLSVAVFASSTVGVEDESGSRAAEASGATGNDDQAINEDSSKPQVLSVEDLAASVRKSLVVVHSTGRDGRDLGQGTGFVIDGSGLIATARHVIGDGRPVRVELADGTSIPVTQIESSSEKLDMVVLRVANIDLPPLALAEAEIIAQGRDVVAMGHPHGLKNSIVAGVVSGTRDVDGVEMLQLAMSIEPGNSGGPVVDRSGRVVGMVTLKSTASENIGYAVPVRHLLDMQQDPNPIDMNRWMTIGALDSQQWNVLWGANWRQRAGRIHVDGYGTAFGGRSLCLKTGESPELPYELQVEVRLSDERGAAGLAFHADGGDRHYGFYPSAGNVRVTRFNGPDLSTWTILHNEPHPAYRADDWNTIRVSVTVGGFECFLNDESVVKSSDDVIPFGTIGLAVFRGTEASFRSFRYGADLPSSRPDASQLVALESIVQQIKADRPATEATIQQAVPVQAYASRFLGEQAERLEAKARHLRQLSDQVRATMVRRDLKTLLDSEQESGSSVLARCALLLARLDNDEVDVDVYLRRIEQMANEVRRAVGANATEKERLQALDDYLFQQNGFRGSRYEYYTRSNSYLNEVIDDREGLPITLSVLYIELARQLDLDVVGIGLPGHFVVRFEPSGADDESHLVDVFDRARRMSDEEAEQLVRSRGFPMLPEFVEAKSTRQIIERMLLNLLNLAEDARQDERVLRYLETLVTVSPDAPEYRAKRLEIRARTGRLQEAIADANWFIDESPEGTNQDQLFELRTRLEVELELQQAKAGSATP